VDKTSQRGKRKGAHVLSDPGRIWGKEGKRRSQPLQRNPKTIIKRGGLLKKKMEKKKASRELPQSARKEKGGREKRKGGEVGLFPRRKNQKGLRTM